MRLQASPAFGRALAALRERAERLRQHRFWLECAALASASLIACALVGRASLARAAELDREAARLEQVRGEMDVWLRELQPPTPAESAAWRASELQLASLGGGDPDPLSVAGRLTRRAEEVGVHDVGVQLANPDSIEPPPATEAAGWVVDAGPTPLALEFAGDWASILGFLGALPPDVQVGSLDVSRAGERLRARAVIFTREATLPR